MMTDQEHPDEEAVDRLVGAYVERVIENVDTTPLLARIRASRQQEHAVAIRQPADIAVAMPRASRPWSRTCLWTATTVLAALVAFLSGRHLDPQSAKAAGMLRTLQSKHAAKIDCCYRVQFTPDPRYWDGKNQLDGPSTSVLWTRNDRFWSDCTIGKLHFKLGREVDGTLWISPSPSKGIRFANSASQLPKTVSLICAINSMSVPQLIEDVLADFELHADSSGPGAMGAKPHIWARLKPGRTHPLLSDALLEIDPATNVLNRLVLWMVRDGHPKGTATFTLMESSQQGDDQYRLTAHVLGDAKIEEHTLAVPDNEPDLDE